MTGARKRIVIATIGSLGDLHRYMAVAFAFGFAATMLFLRRYRPTDLELNPLVSSSPSAT